MSSVQPAAALQPTPHHPSVGIDWTGNDITIEAVADPDVKGVVCHLAYFNRSIVDKLQQGTRVVAHLAGAVSQKGAK